MTRDLLLVTLGNATVGVWEEDISSIAAAKPLHRLPLSPPAVAGMAIIEDRGATIFDLGACLGMTAGGRQQSSRFLLIEEDGLITGFAVAGKTGTARCADDRVFALPGAVRTSVIGSCTVIGGEVVPIVAIRELYRRLRQGVLDAPAPDPAATDAGSADVPGETFRLFSIGGELFCMRGEGSSSIDAAATRITSLPYARGFVKGVLYYEGSVLPVLTLAGPLGAPDAGAGTAMLFADIGGARYGVVVDGDLGLLGGDDVRPLPLPALVRTSWMHEAVVREGTAVPMIDLPAFLASPDRNEAVNVRDVPAAPVTEFLQRFQKGSLEVVEFSLLGSRHALPKEEVQEVLPAGSFRRIPGVPEIVLGVAEQAGELLPVLDLAAIFGRRTTAGGRARMLRIANGDFHALVLVEAVGDDRVLAPDVQRQVPIALPHHVLYGCYLDDRAVRLIMNVHSLAVHFERTEVRDLVASLASAPDSAVDAMPERMSAAPAPSGPAVLTPQPERASMESGAAAEAEREQEAIRQRLAAEAAEREEAKQQEEMERARELERGRKAQEEAARLREEAAARVKAEAEAAAKAEAERKAAEEARQREEAEARERAEKEKREQEAIAARARAEEEERQRIEAEARQRAEDARKRAEEAAEREREAREAAASRARTEAEQQRRRAEERLRQVAAGEMRGSGMPEQEQRTSGTRKPSWTRKTIAAAAIAAMLALVLYWAGGPSKTETGTDTIQQEHAPAVNEPVPAKEPEAPLVLNIPPTMPRPEQVVYVVVKGDTLWDISKRFTGDPFNYPRVAKDNSIATPDLIFPGQRIRLVQEK